MSNHVIELTDQTFQRALDGFPSIMIDFYAFWCGHCKKFQPIYESASEEIIKAGLESVLTRIDAYVYQSIKKEWKIGGYPTILYYQNGKLVERYKGERSVAAIVSYLTEKEKALKLKS